MGSNDRYGFLNKVIRAHQLGRGWSLWTDTDEQLSSHSSE